MRIGKREIYNENSSSVRIQWLLGSHFVRGVEGKEWQALGLSRKEVDYPSVDHLSAWIREHKPTFLVNAAGFTGKRVDACEKDKSDCLFGNAVLPGRIREVCEEHAMYGAMFPADVFIRDSCG